MNIQISTKRPKPFVLLILDGFGVSQPNRGNAVTLAKTPNLDEYWKKYQHTYLQASGNYVGLPQGIQGNSEVGHMSIGAGKIIFQEIARIDREIEKHLFFSNATYKQAIDHVKKYNGNFHLMGLVSDGKVHSSLDHLFACLEFCKKEGLNAERIFIHAFTDGRDSPPKSALKFLSAIKSKNIGRIASVIGRYFAMDRDQRWERTRQAYELLVEGIGTKVKSVEDVLDSSYRQNITDEYIKPHVIVENDLPIGIVNSGDALIFFNYRADRAVQLSEAFDEENFNNFPIKKLENFFFAGFSNYEKGIPMTRAEEDIQVPGGESAFVKDLFQEELKITHNFPKKQIFPPEEILYSLGKIVSDEGLRQLRIAESEKYPHVTYFFGCREKGILPGEDRIEISSPKDVSTYDQKPEMSAYEITKTVEQKIQDNIYDFILVNFAQTDMVAHTGNLEASIKCVEVADECMGRIVKATLEKGGEVLITADHGNVEELINLQTGEIDTQHSTNPVPFVLVSNENFPKKDIPIGMLADIGPTVLNRLKIVQPDQMIGRNLVSSI